MKLDNKSFFYITLATLLLTVGFSAHGQGISPGQIPSWSVSTGSATNTYDASTSIGTTGATCGGSATCVGHIAEVSYNAVYDGRYLVNEGGCCRYWVEFTIEYTWDVELNPITAYAETNPGSIADSVDDSNWSHNHCTSGVTGYSAGTSADTSKLWAWSYIKSSHSTNSPPSGGSQGTFVDDIVYAEKSYDCYYQLQEEWSSGFSESACTS